jgi:beta-phosphoglucomutase-like phosphatase (HAD superfamily)
MDSGSKSAEQKKESDAATRSPYLLLVELEGAAVPARHAEYETLCSLMGDAKKNVPAHLFSRLALDRAPASYVPELLEALGSKKGSEKLAEEIASGLALYLSSSDAAFHPVAEQLLIEANRREIDVALLTFLKESIARGFAARWPEVCNSARVIPFEPVREKYPRADVLLKTAKSLGRTPRQCLVLAGTANASRAALSAGMRCVVLSDCYTAHQDFGGVDLVIEPGETCDVAALLNRIMPAL